MSLERSSTDGTTCLIRQGQQVIVEEDGGDRHYIILVVIPHSESQKR